MSGFVSVAPSTNERPVSAPPTSAPPRTTAPQGALLDGLVTGFDMDVPPTLDCFPSATPDPTALCPPAGDEVLGTVTIDETVVLVTEATVVETCGPTDGPMAIAFEDVEERLGDVTALTGYATVVAPPSGPSSGWARATSVFLGSCG